MRQSRFPGLFAAASLLLAAVSADITFVEEFNSTEHVSGFNGAKASQSPESAHFGRFGLAIDYEFETDTQGRVRSSPGVAFTQALGTGTLSLWVRGDGSQNSLNLEVARSYRNDRGQKLYAAGERESGAWATWLQSSVKLSSTAWQEVTLRIPALSAEERGRKTEVEVRLLLTPHLEKERPTKGAGRIAIDSTRLLDPTVSGVKAFAAVGLVGRSPLRSDQQIEVFANLINGTETVTTVEVQTLVVDRNEAQVGGSETRFALLKLAEIEKFIPLELDVAAATPPLSVAINVRCRELNVQTSRDMEVALVNARQVVDSFDQVHTRWWTKAGYVPGGTGQNHVSHQRPSKQIRIEPFTSGVRTPPSCLKVRYDLTQKDSAAIATDQYLPGGPVTLGVWVKGDGSPHQLWAALEERHPITGFTWRWMWGTPPWDQENRNYGGPNAYNHQIRLGDFSGKDWQFLSATLPGAGLGNYNLKLRGPLVDFPFEFLGFFIVPVKDGPATGEVLLDDLTVDTQVGHAETLTAFVFADDQAQDFARTKRLQARLQNSALLGEKRFNCTWNINDAAGQTVFSQAKSLELPPGSTAIEALEVEPIRKQLSAARGPLEVTATLVDAADPARRASHRIWLKKPDANVLCHDFESDRGYLPAGEFGPSEARSAANAHDGKFAMLLRSAKGDAPDKPGRSEGVRLDPALPGIATAVSVWVFGDGRGMILQPYLTDSAENGRHSIWPCEHFALSPIEVTWQGWRQAVLDLPNLGEQSLGSENRVAELTYPVDLSFATEGEGQVWIDEFRVLTHLPPEQRVLAAVDWPDETHLFPLDAVPCVWVQNADLAGHVDAEVSIALNAADGSVVAADKRPLKLAPMARDRLPLCAKGLPAGVYSADVRVSHGGAEVARLHECLQVCDARALLGQDYRETLRNDIKLRLNVLEAREADLLDWDNTEPLPGRFHFNWFDARLEATKAKGFEPMVRLGYAADWAGSQGYEQLTRGTYQRAFPNSMHVPSDVRDWSEYVRSCMRHYRNRVGRWLIWENPNSGPPLNVPPAKMAGMLAAAQRWNRLYCPGAKVYLGGVLQQGGLDYLASVRQADGGDSFYGVEWKADMGGLPPERAGLDETLEDLRAILGPERAEPDRVIVTGLDWATGPGRADEFQQAAWIVRAHLILKSKGVGLPLLAVSNDACERDAGGLVYRPQTGLASGPEQMPFSRIKPSYLAAWHIRRAAADWTCLMPVELLDVLPQQSRCLLFQAKDGLVAALWRSEGDPIPAAIPAPVGPAAATNGFGHSIDPGRLHLSAMPVLLTYKGVPADALASALGLARLKLPEGNWSLVEHMSPASPEDRKRLQYAVNLESKPVVKADFLPGAGRLSLSGLEGLTRESFVLPGRPAGELFLRRRYLLTGNGQQMALKVNGKELGVWNLHHSRTVPTAGGGTLKLPGGFRDAYCRIPSEALSEKEQRIELLYEPSENAADNNSYGVWILSTASRKVRLTQIGAIYAVIGRGRLQFDRNIAAGPLVIGNRQFATGLGTHSPALIEYPLGRVFKRFTATVGIDRATEGRGSVIFEVHGDDKLLFKTLVMSGFSEPRTVDVDVTGVDRLTLIVKDADDGSENDYANWCDAVLDLD
jgi:hypothetical protein